MTVWGGRIAGGRDPRAVEFLDRGWDEELIAEWDVVAAIAHVRALEDAGLLTPSQAKKLVSALQRLEVTLGEEEDVHSAVEHALGELGARLHAGRSRNDLVATDLRLWARAEVLAAAEAVLVLRRALVDRAAEHAAALAPGYTHLQRAQPVTVGHWLLAHAAAFARDTARLFAAHEAADRSPLGAGALAGTTLPLRPAVTAELLGFSRPFENSLDAVSDRDFLADALYAAAMTASHLSRLGEEIVLWSTAEFGFVRLPDAFATGSSMMPQKKNPDVAEVARAEAGATAGGLVDLLVTLKSLPLAYDRDLQAVKRPLRALHRTGVAVHAMAGLVETLTFDVDRLREAASDDRLLATDLAEALVARGVPFRRAHEQVAAVARRAEQDGTSLAEALRSEPVDLELDEALRLLEPREALRRRATPGGPSPRSVRTQIGRARRAAEADGAKLERLRARLPDRRTAARQT